MAFAVYAYLGYYNVCYLGDEVRRSAARTLPRSILASAVAAVALFTLLHLALVGVVPWRHAVESKNLVGDFMERIHGQWAAVLATVFLIGSCFASTFAGMLGYSRVPYAAARNGHFLRWFIDVHPDHQIPHRSLLLIGAMVLFWSFFSLDMVISALIATLHSGAVRGPGIRRRPAAKPATEPAQALAHVALPVAVRHRHGRLAIRLCHDQMAVYLHRSGHVAGGTGSVPGLGQGAMEGLAVPDS